MILNGQLTLAIFILISVKIKLKYVVSFRDL